MIAVSSRLRRSPNYCRRLSDDQVRNIIRRSGIYFVSDDGAIVDGQIYDWMVEMHGPRAGQLGAVVYKPDDQTAWLWGVDPASHELVLNQQLVAAGRVTH